MEFWFAWHPVKLKNGNWAWMRKVRRRLVTEWRLQSPCHHLDLYPGEYKTVRYIYE